MNAKSIKFKLAGMVAAVGAVAMILIGTSYFSLTRHNDHFTEVFGDLIPSITAANTMNGTLAPCLRAR